jgi:hypothetical protein
MPGNCKFNKLWVESDEFKAWLRPAASAFKGRCIWCLKEFDISNMGVTALRSHAKSSKVTAIKTIDSFCDSSEVQSQANNSSINLTLTSVVSSNNEVVTAEILWTLKCILSHYSYNSCTNINSLFQNMFPDSQIAKKFTCGENKIAYIVCFGLKPYFDNLLFESIKETAQYFVLMFDESHNSVLQKKQMDIHVRFWDDHKNIVVSRYVTSEFLGHARATDMVPLLMKCIDKFGLDRIIQVICHLNVCSITYHM